MLRTLLDLKHIEGVTEDYLNPASIDLPLSDEAYRLESVFLPPPERMVRALLSRIGATKHDLKQPLEVGVPYLIRIAGKWNLPPRVFGYVNPKSSTGRLFLLSRTVADGVDMYDALAPAGWSGELWVLVRADAFPVLLAPGLALSQARFFDGSSFLDPLETDFAIKEHGLLFDPGKNRIKDPRRHRDSFFLTLQVGESMGWECRGSNKVLDLSQKPGSYDPSEFFEPVHLSGEDYTLRKGSFYILTTKERVMIPPKYSAELRAMDPRFGEMRTHAAGYIDPGWGWGTDGSECGRPITLELTLYENRDVWDGQNIARIRYEHMKEEPVTIYDTGKPHYAVQQKAALAKWFTQ